MNGSRYPKHTSLEQHDDESSSTKSSTFINPAAKAKGAKVAVLIDARALPSSRENSYVQKQLKLHEDHEEVNEEFISKQFKHDTSSPSSACSALSKCLKEVVKNDDNSSRDESSHEASAYNGTSKEEKEKGGEEKEKEKNLEEQNIQANEEPGAMEQGTEKVFKSMPIALAALPLPETFRSFIGSERQRSLATCLSWTLRVSLAAQQTIVMAEDAVETISFQYLLIDQHLILDTARTSTSTCLSRRVE